MQNPHPSWTENDWHRAAANIGFSTVEEEDWYEPLWLAMKEREEKAAAELEALSEEAGWAFPHDDESADLPVFFDEDA